MASKGDCTSEKFNTDGFISETENFPVTWALQNDDYSNKNAKRNAWEAVIAKFVPNFSEMSEAEKKVIGTSYQRKCKSLRDSYTRELAKQRNEMKSGSTTKYRRKYLYFEQLKFLDTTTKPTEDSIDLNESEENATEGTIVDGENTGKQEKPKGKTKKRHPDDEFLDMLKKKYCQMEMRPNKDDDNDDKLFLLSLCKDLSSIPDHMKLHVKPQIFGVISSAKQAAYASANAVHQFPSTSQYQMPKLQFPQQLPPQVQYQQPPMVNRSSNVQPPNYGNEQFQDRTQNLDFSWSRATLNTQSPDDVSSNNSELSTDVF